MSARLAWTLLICFPALQACTSVDAERQQLRGALNDARSLAAEVETWSRRVEGDVSQTTVSTIEGFKERAGGILDLVTGVSDNATTGLDLTGVKQALTAMANFDTSRIADASQSGRSSVVRQFGAAASSLEQAAAQAGAKAGG